MNHVEQLMSEIVTHCQRSIRMAMSIANKRTPKRDEVDDELSAILQSLIGNRTDYLASVLDIFAATTRRCMELIDGGE